MPYVPVRCDTVLIPTGPSGDHLFVITTDACPAGKMVLANLSSVKPNRMIDDTCLVAAGEHPFVQHDSFILYRSAQLQSAQRIGNMVDGWVYKNGQPATTELTDRILAGFAVSKFTPRFILAHLRVVGLIP